MAAKTGNSVDIGLDSNRPIIVLLLILSFSVSRRFCNHLPTSSSSSSWLTIPELLDFCHYLS